MPDFEIPDKTQETNIDRAADSLLVYDNSATALRRATVNNLLDLTSHPVGINDTQTLTNKTITAPTVSDPVLSGTVTGTYTLGGTPTFPSAVVTLTGSQTLTNKVLTSPTINTATIANPTLTTDTVSEHTAANGVTVDGLNIKDSKLNTNNSVVTANITDAAVTPAKLLAGTGSSWEWTSWTPTLTNLSGGTITYAKYIQIGKTIHWSFKYTLAGAGVAGRVSITLPATIDTTALAVGESMLSRATFNDQGTATFYGQASVKSSTEVYIDVNGTGSTYLGITSLSSTVPHTWANTDTISAMGTFPVA